MSISSIMEPAMLIEVTKIT